MSRCKTYYVLLHAVKTLRNGSKLSCRWGAKTVPVRSGAGRGVSVLLKERKLRGLSPTGDWP